MHKNDDIVSIAKVLTLLSALFIVSGFFLWYVYPGRDRMASLFWGLFNQTDYSTTILLTVRNGDNLCMSGSSCKSEQHLYQNGTFDGHDSLSTHQIRQLGEAIDGAAFTEYNKKTQPDCSSSDVTLLFPQKYPGQSFRICELEIPPDDIDVQKIDSIIKLH